MEKSVGDINLFESIHEEKNKNCGTINFKPFSLPSYKPVILKETNQNLIYKERTYTKLLMQP